MAGSIGKLTRGSLAYNKNYKPNGLKAYARAALKCLWPLDSRNKILMADLCAQTTSALRSKDRYVLSRKLDKLGSLDTTRASVARLASMATCSPRKMAAARQAMYP